MRALLDAAADSASTCSRCSAVTSGPSSVSGAQPGAEPHRADGLGAALGELVGEGAVDEEAGVRGADLAAVEERALQAAGHGRVEVGVGQTMLGLLPPSSSETRLRLPAEARTIARPVSVEPVKETLSTPGCSTRARPGLAARRSTG